jgi:hypothetical protein
MKRTLRTIRVLLDKHHLGNSINALLAALSATATFYGFYFAVLIGIQAFFDVISFGFWFDVRPAAASVLFDFFAIGLLWRYWTPTRVLRFWLRAIHEVATPYWFAWTQGRRFAALSPILILLFVGTLAFAIIPMLHPRNAPRVKATGSFPASLRVEDVQSIPCFTRIDTGMDNK